MAVVHGQGNYINGAFHKGSDKIQSQNPAQNFEAVFETTAGLSLVDQAVEGATKAFLPWSKLPQEQRNQALIKVKESFAKHEEEIAKAITQEMGKTLSEARGEAKNLGARIDIMIKHGLKRVATEGHPELMAEARYHPQGAVAVLGPYNFPAHLINAHVIPALLTGNTVVVKPSEICPWVGEIYAKCMHEAGLPSGVFNMVQGRGDIGKALALHQKIQGVLFTGSYATGHAIAESVLDQPQKIVALEMGGKNFAVVLDDADLYQALVEITQGAFLTTGQRCTATSRVLVTKKIADTLIDSLIRVTKELKPGDPTDSKTAFGPLATATALERYLGMLKQANCDSLVKHEVLGGGAFVTPSLHILRDGQTDLPGYLDTELFGPDICIEIIDDLDQAIERINQSPFGLSNSVFTAKKSAFEQFYRETRAGVVNWNRSTNGASGLLPFGGLGKSGNQRAAGIDAVRYTTFPVAINSQSYGSSDATPEMSFALNQEKDALSQSIESLSNRHWLEATLEKYGIPIYGVRGSVVLVPLHFLGRLQGQDWLTALAPFATVDEDHLAISVAGDFASLSSRLVSLLEDVWQQNVSRLMVQRPLHVNLPSSGKLPQSEAMLQRLYDGNFVPKEKKSAVIDLHKSRGPYLTSVDENPLVIFDAASQIATIGVGFQSGIFMRTLDEGMIQPYLASNAWTHDAQELTSQFGNLLLSQTWERMAFASFVSGGAEANEKAFDLCRQNGPGGKRIIAFDGSFHGRTLMALQATYNPEKRAAFEFKGYEATFVPFPSNPDPRKEPEVAKDWILAWSKGQIPAGNGDNLLAQEIASLTRLKEEIAKGDIACVIIEPMQCEGGDNYATKRFFNGLRALTRALGVPLVFDEVQTGFGLLGPFFAHQDFDLRNADGQIDGPDCVTVAKKAQVGACLSVWPDPRQQIPHAAQILRGKLQAEAMLSFSPKNLEREIALRLDALKERFSDLVDHARIRGYAFAFDLPSKHLANQLINQRFYRGFMAYIAGEKTIRFRANIATSNDELDALFKGIAEGLQYIRRHGDNEGKFVVPMWVDAADVHPQPALSRPAGEGKFRIEVLSAKRFDELKPQIEELEGRTYEPGRQDSMQFLRDWLTAPGGLGLAVFSPEDDKKILGYAFGGPIENSHVDGPKQDAMNGKHNTFYSANVVISEDARGLGVGFKLKKAQVEHVLAMKREDGSPYYWFMTGRNRIGFTPEINRINRSFGAYTLAVFENQYGTPDGKAAYYRIPLRRQKVATPAVSSGDILEWGYGVQAPVGTHSQELLKDIQEGVFTSAVGTKLTLSNFVTPDLVRHGELLRRLAPKGLKHTYFTSGQSELVDKGLRCLRVNRPQADIAIGFEKQFVGNTTAAARSLSDRNDQSQPFAWFDWPLVGHPQEIGIEAAITKLNDSIKQYSPERVLGIVVELMGEKSGYVFSPDWLSSLNQVREKTGVPLIFVETASALGRNGQSLFMSDSLAVKPNMVWWYCGGQLGHIFVDDQFYVDKPLTLISTWDGDEISVRRTYRHLLTAIEELKTPKTFKLDLGVKKYGQGLWWAYDFGSEEECDKQIERALKAGVRLQKGVSGRAIVCPPINVSQSELDEGIRRLKL